MVILAVFFISSMNSSTSASTFPLDGEGRLDICFSIRDGKDSSWLF